MNTTIRTAAVVAVATGAVLASPGAAFAFTPAENGFLSAVSARGTHITDAPAMLRDGYTACRGGSARKDIAQEARHWLCPGGIQWDAGRPPHPAYSRSEHAFLNAVAARGTEITDAAAMIREGRKVCGGGSARADIAQEARHWLCPR
ncbi:hypothetical protein [Tsukamurella spumae]|uniref:DUF732 domain-containing protein n=1 Tax=Tsukamurella spumae TaxID=44753 RepID=A0A846WWB5_9ACTN|nr:hypothetical protein [Tsukamurella spumae]NKY17448.1 hypothetical protein [Tsukamurella spumae]